MVRFALVAGARPNFMKIAPILRELDARDGVETVLVHTGQHYDRKLSDVFFEELGIRSPDVFLNVGSGTHAVQTSAVMVAIENFLMEQKEVGTPIDRVIVVGDVNSTMAAAIAATKVHVPVAHVEAGLRSFDRTMPEEINRLVTDAISDVLLCSEPSGVDNLLREGHAPEHIHLVGNVMIDTLFLQVERAKQQEIVERLGLHPREYGVVTLHRPANVDSAETLGKLLGVLTEISSKLPIVFPVHPRTASRIDAYGLRRLCEQAPGMRMVEPLGYLDFLCLTSQAKLVVTDSGGLQEESTALNVPCLTLRSNTERPITCTEGTSTLIGDDADALRMHINAIMNGSYKRGQCPDLWDGQAAVRIANVLVADSTPDAAKQTTRRSQVSTSHG